ncbi:YciI family protein [Pseudoduganella sp. OTU4001]|uniref:YciI family protein n=1 Tax=Pseudoduganella sp. OTU4001 TaxID=3043854 RepID=UPI00313E2A60
MFVVSLKITGSKDLLAPHLPAHKEWLQAGFDDGIFLAAGNLQGHPGGGILVRGIDEAALQERLAQDPFVANALVDVSVIGFTPAKTDSRLEFLRVA